MELNADTVLSSLAITVGSNVRIINGKRIFINRQDRKLFQCLSYFMMKKMFSKLTEFEKEVHDFIEGRGEILTSNMPTRMSGAIPSLKNKGVIEVFKKSTSRWTSKKRKFVRIRGSRNGSEEET